MIIFYFRGFLFCFFYWNENDVMVICNGDWEKWEINSLCVGLCWSISGSSVVGCLYVGWVVGWFFFVLVNLVVVWRWRNKKKSFGDVMRFCYIGEIVMLVFCSVILIVNRNCFFYFVDVCEEEFMWSDGKCGW